MILSRLLSRGPTGASGRSMSSCGGCVATVLRYAEHGDPLQVIQRCEETVPPPKDTEVLVQMLLAPINPADINTIQGKYPDKPPLPAVPGNECLGEIIALGSAVTAATGLAIGDRIIPNTTQTGTWRTHSILPATAVQRVPSELDAVAAATLTVNPPSAYRMLRDFVRLQQGDTVIQNGGNSAVGQAVAQLCRIWGVNCVSVVRDRPDVDQLKAFLCSLGATEVLTETEVRTTGIFKGGRMPRPRLALNCVGGKSATEILRHLGEAGQLVTYGAMSREPVTAPNAALIFKDIAFRGFWMSRWGRENAQSAQREEMLAELQGWYLDGQLRAPVHELVPFAEWKRALSESIDFKGFTGKKFILQF